MTSIEINKTNSITRDEFKMLIKDPKIHLIFLKQRLTIRSNNNIDDIIEELDDITTDIYYADILERDNVCVVYFWSLKDFGHFRK